MYSQNGEDNFLLEHFSTLENGVVVEIGAFTSTDLSNSRALIEKGWTAYLIEASPFCITNLFEAYKNNDKVNIIQSIVDNDKKGLTSFHDYPFSAVSCIDKENMKKYFKHISEEEFKNNSKELFIQTIDLKTLMQFVLDRESKIDFLSIDIEGNSANLSMTLDLNQVQPTCICIEHDSQERQIEEYFKNHYNLVNRNGENVILVKK